MSRTVRDYVRVDGHGTLDQLIEQLTAIRDSLPAEAGAEVQLRGDEFFGHHIAVAFRRPLTAEEAACEGRYAAPPARHLKAA